MTSVAELIEQLKEGKITKEEMIEKVSLPFFTQSSLTEKTLTCVDTVPDDTHISQENSPDHETEFEQNYLIEDEDYYPRLPPSMTPKDYSDSLSSNFLHRQIQWDLRRSVEQERLKAQQQQIIKKNCTFQPTTNIISHEIIESPFERLSRIKENFRLQKLREEQERMKEEEELRGCTFKPEINRTEIQPRYLDANEQRMSPRLKLMLKDQCTFAPKVKGVAKGMKSVKEYVKQDPFERLSKPKEIEEPKEPEEEINSSSKQSIVSSTGYQEYGDSFSSRPFFERQALYELMKIEKKNYYENMPAPAPMICERSKKLVKKEFYERNNEMIEKKLKTLKNTEKPEGCTFQPKITKKAKLKKNRSFAEMCHGDSKKREENINAKKEEINQNFRNFLDSGLFQSKRYTNVTSTIKILDDPDSYVARMKDQQRISEQRVKSIIEEREKQELAECTHAPITIDAPSYVKQIARNMAMLKAERAANQEPKKPEWR
ncbi:unnamed protein product [Blepharisma stoltei]|uniref:Uncharacterized protein n=1 Tax=Blepharisma stoltei TaxID=1481888 RepID=A0AAU9ILF3_9CILI|nr:unnamed protein product [Blepharisma stoltei]